MNNQADLLLINGVIDTLDHAYSRVASLAVKAGKVHSFGVAAEADAGPGTTVVDLGGGYVMPGLVDVHNHHMVAGQMDLFELNEAPTKTLDELLSAVTDQANRLAQDQWVIGGSWGSGLLSELNSPDALARLDAATSGRPAVLKDDSKHNRWANSRALELSGIIDDTPDPEGGQILRDPSGRATGVLIEAGGVLVEQTLARLQPP